MVLCFLFGHQAFDESVSCSQVFSIESANEIFGSKEFRIHAQLSSNSSSLVRLFLC